MSDLALGIKLCIKTMTNLAQNYRTVNERIRAAEFAAARASGSVQLVAVGKLHPASAIRELAACGQRGFAENFVQEALSKQDELSDLNLEWHFIGSIQSNKTRQIANHFSWVHSVDRFKIANRLNDQRAANLPALNVCLQLNLQAEETKSGLNDTEVMELLDATTQLTRIRVRGFMIVPKPTSDPEAQRTIFAQVRNLLEQANLRGHSLDTLSMGMTDDLEQAISEGSTHVRIGTALFGARPTQGGV